MVIRRAAGIPPEFLELVEEMGCGYGYAAHAPGEGFRSHDSAPEGRRRLVIQVYGRSLLEYLLAAVRRALPRSSVRARRVDQG